MKSDEAIRREARRKSNEMRISNVAFLVLLPAVMAVLGAVTSDLSKNIGWNNTIAIWVVVLVIFGLFWWRANPSTQSFLEVINQNNELMSEVKELVKTNNDLEISITNLSAESIFSFTTRFMVASYVDIGIKTLEDLNESLAELGAPIHFYCEFLFGTQGSEVWSFSVYLYSNEQDLLIPVWREKSTNHPSDSQGRAWGMGQGHVGKAFVDRKAIITPNSQHPDVVALSSAPDDLARPYDADTYLSFASIPIGPIHEGQKPFGVVVATSDREGRFNKENAGILNHFADVIASLVHLAHIDIDRFESPDPTQEPVAAGEKHGAS